jgi:hypothetical protein
VGGQKQGNEIFPCSVRGQGCPSKRATDISRPTEYGRGICGTRASAFQIPRLGDAAHPPSSQANGNPSVTPQEAMLSSSRRLDAITPGTTFRSMHRHVASHGTSSPGPDPHLKSSPVNVKFVKAMLILLSRTKLESRFIIGGLIRKPYPQIGGHPSDSCSTPIHHSMERYRTTSSRR